MTKYPKYPNIGVFPRLLIKGMNDEIQFCKEVHVPFFEERTLFSSQVFKLYKAKCD